MSETENRKLDHIKIALKESIESKTKTGFEDITLVHRALPEIDKDEINLETKLFGKKFSAPIIIAAMTGGHKKTAKINKNLAIAAEKLNIPMGVGSQRAAIEDKLLEETYSIARESAPNAFLIGNLGAVQFNNGYTIKEAKKAVKMIKANALAIHLNPTQEALQPEGDYDFKGCLSQIKKLSGLDVPIIAKETGAGIAREEAKTLKKAGVSALDIGGLGGTSFAAVEYYRLKENKNRGKRFWDWGIPTVVSTVETVENTSLPIISTGGIRNGVEITKALALGATTCGIALPLLEKALKGPEKVIDHLTEIIEEIKITMFLSGANNIAKLRKSDLIIMGKTKEWLENRNIDCKKYANRKQ